MNHIGNHIFINQNAPVISSFVSNNLHATTIQSAVAFQIFANKQQMIRRATKVQKTTSIDPQIEHEKETQREYHFSTEEYEKMLKHEDTLPPLQNEKNSKNISEYRDIRDEINHHIKKAEV